MQLKVGASFLLWFKRKMENPKHTPFRRGGRGVLPPPPPCNSLSGIFPATLVLCFVILWVWVFRLRGFVHHTHAVPAEAGRGQTPSNQNYGLFQTACHVDWKGAQISQKSSHRSSPFFSVCICTSACYQRVTSLGRLQF